MLRIEEPIYFILLLALPILAIIFYFYKRYSQRLNAYFSLPEDERQENNKIFTRKSIILSLGFLFLILALVNPQYGYRKEKVERESADVYIALDISQSMLAEDLSPSRLERAKKVGERLIESLKTERIGLIFFAGEAYLQMPLTTDYRSAIVFLRNASTTQAGIQGTAIGDAIDMAAKREEDDISNSNRMLIVITDGEDHEGKAAEKALQAYNSETAVFTVGIGTEEGGFIPVIHNNQSDYLRDKTGQPVRSQLNTADLQLIAEKGGGIYFNHTVGNSMYSEIKEKVERMERRNYEKTLFTARESYFQWLLLPGVLLLGLSFLLDYRRASKHVNT
jgi:Ca-activated chloride channel family protein